jgi:hypothetical protein
VEKILEQDSQKIRRIFQVLNTHVYLCEIFSDFINCWNYKWIGITNEEQQDEFSSDENLTQNQSLQRNQNDTKNLKESLNKLKAREDKMLLEIENLKITLDSKDEESKIVAEGIAINSVVEKDKVTEFEKRLEESEKILQRTFNENAQLRTELGEKYTTLEEVKVTYLRHVLNFPFCSKESFPIRYIIWRSELYVRLR